MLLGAFLAGCESGKIGLGGGDSTDARLFADLYTWECDDGLGIYEGVFSYHLSLEYAPDALAPRELPTTGCSASVDLFPRDAGGGGADLEGVTEPTWSNGVLSGSLAHDGPGYYAADVFTNQRTCNFVEDVQGEGTTIADAGVFSGAATPPPSGLDGVHVGGLDPSVGIEFGEETNVNWVSEEWDASWVQVRREQGGVLVESVTCNTTGLDGYTIDDSVWSLMSGYLDADLTNLFVGFQNHTLQEAEDGQKIDLITRVMHVAVVVE